MYDKGFKHHLLTFQLDIYVDWQKQMTTTTIRENKKTEFQFKLAMATARNVISISILNWHINIRFGKTPVHKQNSQFNKIQITSENKTFPKLILLMSHS